jgi:hypothetical protein
MKPGPGRGGRWRAAAGPALLLAGLVAGVVAAGIAGYAEPGAQAAFSLLWSLCASAPW